jgi:exopolysaccharide biosynthesis predicted pyruvyltransferase EpsI
VRASRRARRRADAYFGDPDALAARERILSDRIRQLTDTSSPRLPALGLVWPLSGRITSRFGDRLGRFHAGIDIAAPEGTSVVAVAAGRVVIAETLPELGNAIVLDHGNGFTTLYAHHRESLVAAGDKVRREQTIGLVGSTGRATGPHLHFETRLDGTPRDPSSLLRAEGDAAEALRIETIATLRPVLHSVREVILVGSTLHANAGDSLIWLGQMSLLAELGITVREVVHPASYDRRPFDRSPPDAVVLLSGGGNFGDLWPFVQRQREWIVREITNRRIVQLPQALHFADEASLRSMQDALSRHPDVVLTWRDRDSHTAAEAAFPTTPSILVPDVAFARRPPRTASRPDTKILCIARQDQEGGELRVATLPEGRRADWHLYGVVPTIAREAIWLAARAERRIPVRYGARIRLALYNRSALLTVAAAARLVGEGRVVVSDRLHAHVLCTMLAVPHVMLDSGYGKIRSFLETWPVTSELAHIASSADEAFVQARALL